MTKMIDDRDRGVLLFLGAHFRKDGARNLTARHVAELMGREEAEVATSLVKLADHLEFKAVDSDRVLVAADETLADLIASGDAVVTGLSEQGQQEIAGP